HPRQRRVARVPGGTNSFVARADAATTLADTDSVAARYAALRAGGDPAGSRARLDAYARWLAAAGPWHLYTVCPALVAPYAPMAIAATAPDVRALVEGATKLLSSGNTLVVLDLEPVTGVHIAAELNATGNAHCV